MIKSKNLGLNLPSRDNTTDLADINVVSENFETIDNEFENVYNKLNNTGVINTVSGNPIVLKDSANAPLHNLKLFGKTTQNGIPTPDSPVPLVSVGDSGSFTVKIQGENVEEQTLTMPYTLRGAGDTQDEIDFARGVYIENAYKKVFTGDETTFSTLSSAGGGTYFTYVDSNIAYNITTEITGALCNRLTEKSNNELWVTTNQGFCFGSGSQQFRFRIDGITTITELQAKLKQWHNEGNPLTIVVKRATPIETPLTETELNAYKKLHSNKPTTTIISEADMEVSYVADTKLYIDNKIAELTALTLEV